MQFKQGKTCAKIVPNFALLCFSSIYNDQDDYRLFLIVPYENQTAIFGIIDKMIAPMTVTQLYDNPENCETVCSDRFAYIHDGEFILIDKA